jgi:hypothetical protein
MLLALSATAIVVVALLWEVLAPRVAEGWDRHRARRARVPSEGGYDPGRERRAEQRARALLRSCVNQEEWEMYRDLGFIRVWGAQADGPGRGSGRNTGGAPYAYLVYPHKPIVAFVPETGRLLSEYCVEFPDLYGGGQTRLPASDDVLAKWMALTSDETRVIGEANMHLVGRQHDPSRVRRDLWRLSEWERRRGAADNSIGAHGG